MAAPASRAEDPAQFALFDRSEVDPKLSRRQAADRAAEAAKAERDKTLAEWVARFERADWVAPWDCAGGMKKGDSVLGWRCPACGDVEPTEFGLGNNHGYRLYDTHVPYGAEFGATCFKLELEKNHRIYDERMAMVRHLIDAGLDDEQIASRVGFWSASTIALDRARFAKEDRRAARAAKGEVVKVGHGSDCPCAYCEGPCSCASCEAFRGNPPSCFLCGAAGGLLTLGEPPARQAVCEGGCRPAEDPLQTVLDLEPARRCWECDNGGHVCERCHQSGEHGRAWHKVCPRCPVCDGTGLRIGDFWVNNRRVQVFCDCPEGKAFAQNKTLD